MDNERIEGRAAAEARPERLGLGRYLMSGMTQEEREPPATSVASAFARRAKSAPTSCTPATHGTSRPWWIGRTKTVCT